MNDQDLTTALRKSVEGACMSVPEEQITSRSRAIRAARRRRVAAGATAAVSAGVAAVAATALLPAPAAPAAQDTAYVVSHVARALDAVPSGSVFHLRSAIGNSAVTDMWAMGTSSRIQRTTPGWPGGFRDGVLRYGYYADDGRRRPCRQDLVELSQAPRPAPARSGECRRQPRMRQLQGIPDSQ